MSLNYSIINMQVACFFSIKREFYYCIQYFINHKFYVTNYEFKVLEKMFLKK